jgi:hypothetical protein
LLIVAEAVAAEAVAAMFVIIRNLIADSGGDGGAGGGGDGYVRYN